MDGTLAQTSIHRLRRRWYALWVALLTLSLGFFALWETPAARGEGHVGIILKMVPPAGTQVDWWAGPRKAWTGGEGVFQGSAAAPPDPGQLFKTPLIPISVSSRRFHMGYIPGGTTDAIVLRFRVPGQPPRYAVYDLSHDLNADLAGPHRRLVLGLPVSLESLSQDAIHPTPLQ